jgi:UMP-CMP kinase
MNAPLGKGTQCQLLCSRLRNPQWIHLSAGDLLRAERQKANSSLADEINACLSAGKLVSSQITCQLLINAMQQFYRQSRTVCTHFLIDGFPRSQSNADEWIHATTTNSEYQYHVQFVLNFECPEETLVGRLLERGKVSGRIDDNLSTVQARFRTFQKETAPILDYYRHSTNIPVRTIAADQPVEAVYQDTVSFFMDLADPFNGRNVAVSKCSI